MYTITHDKRKFKPLESAKKALLSAARDNRHTKMLLGRPVDTPNWWVVDANTGDFVISAEQVMEEAQEDDDDSL